MRNPFTRQLLSDKGYVIVDGVARKRTEFDAAPAGPSPIKGSSAVRKMTRCEAALYEMLKARYWSSHITPEFRLRTTAWDAPAAAHYKADFAVFTETAPDSYQVELFEAKDSRRPYHSDELTRPKMALQQNPWIVRITLALWDGNCFTFRVLAGKPAS
jgi:hypothetical protein